MLATHDLTCLLIVLAGLGFITVAVLVRVLMAVSETGDFMAEGGVDFADLLQEDLL